MSTIEETRAIIDAGETYEGSILPTQRAEINRPVTIHEGATVTEGVYGETVTVESGATINGSLMTAESAELEGGTVAGDVGSASRIVGGDARVHGSVTGTRVRLEDCVVLGNIVAQELILEDCLVMGVATGTRRLEAQAATVYTFKSHTEAMLAGVDVLLPQAVVDGEVTLETPVRVLPFQSEGNETVELTQDDFAVHEGTTYLTLAPRLLDLSRVEDRLTSMENVLQQLVEDIKSVSADASAYDREWLYNELDVDSATPNRDTDIDS